MEDYFDALLKDVKQFEEIGVEEKRITEKVIDYDELFLSVKNQIVAEIKIQIDDYFEDKKKEFDIYVSEKQRKISEESIGVEVVSKPSVKDMTSLREAEQMFNMKLGGWIYYVNMNEGNHLWKIKKDGTENQELVPKSIHMLLKIENGWVYYSVFGAGYRKVTIDGKSDQTASMY